MPDNQLTDERRKALLISEPSVLKSLQAAPAPTSDSGMEARAEIIAIEDVPGQPDFAFRILPIGEDVYKKCEQRNSPPRKDQVFGITVRGDLNEADYRSDLIIESTHPDDRKLLWSNREMLKSKDCQKSTELVDRLLPYGWKMAVVSVIDKISGNDRMINVGASRNGQVQGEHSCPACGKVHEADKPTTLENELRD